MVAGWFVIRSGLAGPHYIDQAGLKLVVILQPLPLKYRVSEINHHPVPLLAS